MKLFPAKNYILELSDNSSKILVDLKQSTLLSDSLISKWTKKTFIGQVSDDGFKLISSDIERGGVFCVLEGEVKNKSILLQIRMHKVFQFLTAILMLMPILGIGIVTYQNGFSDSIRIIITMFVALLILRFLIIEQAFKFVSKRSLMKLENVTDKSKRVKNEVQQNL